MSLISLAISAGSSRSMSRGKMGEAIALDHKNIPLRDFAKSGADEGWRVPYCGADR